MLHVARMESEWHSHTNHAYLERMTCEICTDVECSPNENGMDATRKLYNICITMVQTKHVCFELMCKQYAFIMCVICMKMLYVCMKQNCVFLILCCIQLLWFLCYMLRENTYIPRTIVPLELQTRTSWNDFRLETRTSLKQQRGINVAWQLVETPIWHLHDYHNITVSQYCHSVSYSNRKVTASVFMICIACTHTRTPTSTILAEYPRPLSFRCAALIMRYLPAPKRCDYQEMPTCAGALCWSRAGRPPTVLV
jgi:hypothetical protein